MDVADPQRFTHENSAWPHDPENRPVVMIERERERELGNSMQTCLNNEHDILKSLSIYLEISVVVDVLILWGCLCVHAFKWMGECKCLIGGC